MSKGASLLVRLRPGQHEAIKAMVKATNQSMSGLVLTAIDRHLDQGRAFDELLRIVGESVNPHNGAFVKIHRAYLADLVKAARSALPQDHSAVVAAIAVLGEDPGQ